MNDWIPISDVNPGDRIRAPGGSSWATWRDRDQAESAAVPFLGVERLQPNALSPDLYEVCLAENHFAFLPRDARVLRASDH